MSDQPSTTGEARFRRVVLKLSGESFAHAGERGISMEEVVDISRQIQQAQQMGCEIAVVIVLVFGLMLFKKPPGLIIGMQDNDFG